MATENFLSNLPFLGNPLHDFLGRAYFSIPILHTSSFCLCEVDLPIDLLDVAEIAEIQIIDSSLETQYQNFSFPNFSLQPQPQLHITFAERVAHLGRPSQLSVQGFFGDCLCLSTNAQRLCLDLSFPFDCELEIAAATNSLSNSAPDFWGPERLDT